MFYALLKIRFDPTSTNSKQVETKTHLSTNPDMSVPLFYYKEFQKKVRTVVFGTTVARREMWNQPGDPAENRKYTKFMNL